LVAAGGRQRVAVRADVLMHATWNSVIQGGFDVLTVGEGPRAAENVWVGESGVLVAGVGVLVALVVRAAMRRSAVRAPVAL
jgi:uncharacterized protein